MKVIIPMYGRDSPLKYSSTKRKTINPKLTAATPAPNNVTGLYTMDGNNLFMIYLKVNDKK